MAVPSLLAVIVWRGITREQTRFCAPKTHLAIHRVVLGEHGTDVIWPGDIDMAADMLARLSQDQAHP